MNSFLRVLTTPVLFGVDDFFTECMHPSFKLEDGEYVLKLNLDECFNSDNIDIDVIDEEILTIVGKCVTDDCQKSFSMTDTLPCDCLPETLTADYSDNVLTIVVQVEQ